ncbi:MBL fold metallo-hydrolase [methane-oxidizing endosymbiont of Gigantopelta aegis]|uniref:MBL fold metallo-hydrolase n=1 Tax=methane-oxidizing endosymbiont of Gigantopelta aegis TaxID=2794938 RepID=UPI0018DD9AAE|nr:MBL fold metallo-hydrolase [methane-oxidizing endosymbiont of Gigantopelta aegis]
MHNNITLFNAESHRFILLNESDPSDEDGIPSNQYLILHNGKGTLLDPGGFGVMPQVLNVMLQYIQPQDIEAIVLSHQDPDIVGGLSSWMKLTSAKIYVSRIWRRFLPHYGITHMQRFVDIPDDGCNITLNSGLTLTFVPAHFLHSPGQINVYDPLSKILFSGDVGASLVPLDENADNSDVFAHNFSTHLQFTEGFHKRYMASNRALRHWVQQVRKLDVDIIAPQHGLLYRGQVKDEFLDWLYDLPCGSDLLELD